MKRVGNLWGKLCCNSTAVRAIIEGTVNKRQDHIVHRKLGFSDDLPIHQGKLDPAKVQRYAEGLVHLLQQGWKPSPMRHLVVILPSQRGAKSTVRGFATTSFIGCSYLPSSPSSCAVCMSIPTGASRGEV